MRIGVVGVGYVGLPLAVAFAEAGCDVVALDTDAGRVGELNAGRSWIEDVASDRLQGVLERMTATTDAGALGGCSAVLLCVPTPLTENREPDLRPLRAAAETTGDVIGAGTLVVLESTSYPGTTREQLLPILEARSGLTLGDDLHVAFSPERVDPGRVGHDLRSTPKLVGGITAGCLERAMELYGHICDHLVPVSTPEVAELAKLLENIFRSVNIALVNELAILADRMGVDIWETIDAAATKPYGFMRFDPGPGMGGHCLPVDPFYLAWRARSYDMATEFIELAGKINQQMPTHCVRLVDRALNDQALAVRGARVVLLGVAYKAGIADVRQSPALKVIRLLRERGADVVYHDVHVPELPELGLVSTTLDEAVDGADLLVILTAHDGVDYGALIAAGTPVLDLRGVTRSSTSPGVRRL